MARLQRARTPNVLKRVARSGLQTGGSGGRCRAGARKSGEARAGVRCRQGVVRRSQTVCSAGVAQCLFANVALPRVAGALPRV